MQIKAYILLLVIKASDSSPPDCLSNDRNISKLYSSIPTLCILHQAILTIISIHFVHTLIKIKYLYKSDIEIAKQSVFV